MSGKEKLREAGVTKISLGTYDALDVTTNGNGRIAYKNDVVVVTTKRDDDLMEKTFIWLDREKKALTPEEFKNLDQATIEDITTGKASGWIIENLPRKAKAAMGDKEYDSVIIVTTKK